MIESATPLDFAAVFDGLKPLLGAHKEADQYKALAPLLLVAALDAELHATKQTVLEAFDDTPFDPHAPVDIDTARIVAERPFFNMSPFELSTLAADPTNLQDKVEAYIEAFSPEVRAALHALDVKDALRGGKTLKLVDTLASYSAKLRAMTGTQRTALFDEVAMVAVGETAEKAFEAMTPRDVIPLMCELVFRPHADHLSRPAVVVDVYDPAYGTGGFLTQAAHWLRAHNLECHINLRGHEHIPRTAAIGLGNVLIANVLNEDDTVDLRAKSSLGPSGGEVPRADFALCNPPYGHSWKADKAAVEAEKGGRFVALPASSDGQMLFLQQCMDRIGCADTSASADKLAQRAVVISNGSPLFTGNAGSGPSEIRRTLLENDWLDCLIALPPQLYFNTGIQTYLWVIDKAKPAARRGKVRLVNTAYLPASGQKDWDRAFCQPTRRSQGDKRVELTAAHRERIARLALTPFDALSEQERTSVKIFDNEDFGFRRITVERPLRLNFQASEARITRLADERTWHGLLKTKKKGAAGKKAIEAGQAVQEAILGVLKAMNGTKLYKGRPEFVRVLKAEAKAQGVTIPANIQKAILSALSERDETAKVCMKKGEPEPDPNLRDFENVPLKEDIGKYMIREVLPHVRDAWVDESKTKVGYEIPFTRHFYVYEPPRPLGVIKQDLQELEQSIQGMLTEVLA